MTTKKKPTKNITKREVSNPVNITKPVKVTTKNIKTILPTIPVNKIVSSKNFQDKYDNIINEIDIDTEDLSDDLLDIYDELEEELAPKLISKNWKLWMLMFSPVILPGIVKGMVSEPTVPQPKVIIKGKQQNVIPPVIPKKVVDYTRKYFEERGLSLCKSLTETDLSRLKDDLKQNWDKGPDAFAEVFKESYPVSKSRLEMIYKNERHQAEYSGVLERAKNADHSYKRWETIGDERTCDICLAMDGEIVPINEKFSNGQMIPSAHVNCRCSMTSYSEEDYDDLPDEYIRQDAAYLNDVADFIKLNYKCEFNGTDNKCGLDLKFGDKVPEKLQSVLNKSEEQKMALSNREQTAINNYKHFNYQEINGYLRDPTRYLSEDSKEDIQNMDNAFNKISMPDDMVVYSGLRRIPKDVDLKTIGNVFTVPEYTSSSILPQSSYRFAQSSYMLEIEIPKGSKALYVGSALRTNEKEVLINHGSTYEVIGLPEVKTVHNEFGDNNIKVVKVRLVNDNKKKQDAAYLSDIADQMKLNYKCEFNGTDYKCGNTIPSDDSKEIKIDNPFELNRKLSKYININEVQKPYDDAAGELFEKYGSGPDSDWPPELIKEYEDAYDKITHLNKIHIDAVREFNYNAPQINNPTKDREKLLASQLKDTLDTVSTKQDLVMWRGERKSDWEELAKTGSGSTDRFTSITQSKSIAEQFKGGSEPYLIRIEMPAGTHAIPSWNQGVESPNEKEWILNKDTKLEVIGKSGNILNVRVVNNKTKQDSAYLHDVANFIKLNYKCEFNGIDNKCNIDNTSEKDTKSRSRTGTKKSKSVSKPSIDKRTNKDDLHQILLTSKAQSTKFSKAQQSEVDEFFDKYKEYKTMFDYHLKMGVVSMKEKQQINALRNELNDISKKLSKELKFKVSRFDYTKEVAKYIDHVETIEYGMSDPGETPKLGPLDPRRIIEVSHTEKGYAPVLESSKKFLSDNKDFKVTLRDYVSESPFSGMESGYKGVNLLLAGKEPKDPNKAAILLSKLDTLFKEAPPIPIDIMVWRGGSDSDKKRMLSAGNGDLNNLVGSVKECKPFVSCTMSERIADAFASKPFLDYQSNGLIYEITIPKGAKAISTQGTNYEIDEAEILINRGANLLITGVEDMGKKTKIKCSLVSSGGK